MHRRIAHPVEVGNLITDAVERGRVCIFLSQAYLGGSLFTPKASVSSLRSTTESSQAMPTSSIPHNLQLFVDGSYDPLKRVGGWAVLVVRNDVEVASQSGSINSVDSSAPELVAVLEALRWLEVNAIGEAATIWSDSTYAVTGCNRWRHIWRTNHWRKRAPNGKGRSRDVPNVDHWKALDALLTRCDMIEIAWCKGHVGLPWNERADALARQAAKPATVRMAEA